MSIDPPKVCFDIEAFVRDAGGPTMIEVMTGIPRTSMYRWMQQGFVRSDKIALILDANPSMRINKYFKGMRWQKYGT